jgi:hypothetical protein
MIVIRGEGEGSLTGVVPSLPQQGFPGRNVSLNYLPLMQILHESRLYIANPESDLRRTYKFNRVRNLFQSKQFCFGVGEEEALENFGFYKVMIK